jgi:hypothetical protein
LKRGQGGNLEREVAFFRISKIVQFPSKSAKSGGAALNRTANIVNINGAILIFSGFFWPDPLPTPDF